MLSILIRNYYRSSAFQKCLYTISDLKLAVHYEVIVSNYSSMMDNLNLINSDIIDKLLLSEKNMALAINLRLNEKVLFCGKQHKVQDYLSVSEVVVLPTLNKGEGSPLSLLEAMASGKNVLGSNVPGIKDQLQPFPKHLVTAGDVEAWSSALLACCSNTIEENTEAGKVFRDYVLQNYPIDREVASCENLYLKLTNQS